MKNTKILFLPALLCGLLFFTGCDILPQNNYQTQMTDEVTTSNTQDQVVEKLQDNAGVQPEKTDNSTNTTNTKPEANTRNLNSMLSSEKEVTQGVSAEVKTTVGDFAITFTDKMTPKTVANFTTLAKKGFYDGTIFHRVMKGFMIQGGDPQGTGMGGPGYKFDDEPFTGEYTRGTVAMANSGPNTNGSQFFIMHANVPLPKNYVIFGHVTEGMETVDKIANAEVEYNNGEMSKPINPVKIVSVKVIE